MKGRICTLTLAAAALLTACSKDAESIDDSLAWMNSRTAGVSARSVTQISEWEGGYQWNISDSANYVIYANTRAFPELTDDVINEGAVLVFVRNYKKDDGTIVPKAQQLPFAVLPPVGRPAFNNYWYYRPMNGSVTAKFRSNKAQYTSDPVPVPDASTQFRYFVLSKSTLDAWGQTQASIIQLGYDQLTQLAGTAQ